MNSQEPNFNVTDWIKSQHCEGIGNKPIEIYIFIDPLCADCWSLEPSLKKLQIEFGGYISFKRVLGARLAALNKAKNPVYRETAGSRFAKTAEENPGSEQPVSTPYNASIALKAAELQGRKAGIRFLRKLQEMLFLEKMNVSDLDILFECAKGAQLDTQEFIKDFTSSSAAKAFQCDLKITNEMEVQELPTLVFFNQNIEEEGIKVSGFYPYEVYKHILEEMLGGLPEAAAPPSLESFLRMFGLASSSEISMIYDLSHQEVEKEMKKLVLKQFVQKIPAKKGPYWKLME
ncbi:putative DsbA family dithiol-disulfide isomerase [Peribacillus deserti]|uniref:ClpXP adapter protein SpxH n=1 Tax=Peribacillus deserti TaxID=673318 RepID=A0ABS2QL97_9BACI|nr:ClpXP adapter SpxH family protein [Peribacillus deserti]MBM7693947.1 putative DsbA family dithiol-disulfide isomerase [Peribacillus deserti]